MPEPVYFRPRNWSKYQSRSNNSMAWVKVQVALLDDPEYLSLTEGQRLLWVSLLLLFGRTGRPQPLDSRETARQLRLNTQLTAKGLPALLTNNFIELCGRTENLFSELPPPRGDKKRKRRRENPPVVPPTGKGNGEYRWQGQVIHLNEKDYEAWVKAFPDLNLDTELYVRDLYLVSRDSAEQKKWFVSTSSLFAKKNRQAKREAQQPTGSEPAI